MDLNTSIQKINVHVRGGFIIPMKIPGPNLVIGPGNSFQIQLKIKHTTTLNSI